MLCFAYTVVDVGPCPDLRCGSPSHPKIRPPMFSAFRVACPPLARSLLPAPAAPFRVSSSGYHEQCSVRQRSRAAFAFLPPDVRWCPLAELSCASNAGSEQPRRAAFLNTISFDGQSSEAAVHIHTDVVGGNVSLQPPASLSHRRYREPTLGRTSFRPASAVRSGWFLEPVGRGPALSSICVCVGTGAPRRQLSRPTAAQGEPVAWITVDDSPKNARASTGHGPTGFVRLQVAVIPPSARSCRCTCVHTHRTRRPQSAWAHRVRARAG